MLSCRSLLRAHSTNVARMMGIFPRPISSSLNTFTKSRLSSRITAHLSSSKIGNPDKMPRAVSKFIIHHPWNIKHVTGSEEVELHKTIHARAVDVKWSIGPSSGIASSMQPISGVHFTISVSDKLTPQGMVFECRTQKASSYKYVIDRVSCYSSFAERDSLSSYRGPLFASLEPELQGAFDQVLHDWGISTEVIDFIEASAQYYNNLEYIRWLCNINEFISK